MYKVGLVYKRQDIFKAEQEAELKVIRVENQAQIKAELQTLDGTIQTIYQCLEEHTNKQRVFRTDIVSSPFAHCLQ